MWQQRVNLPGTCVTSTERSALAANAFPGTVLVTAVKVLHGLGSSYQPSGDFGHHQR